VFGSRAELDEFQRCCRSASAGAAIN
jgi:hypothetical protein